MKRLLLLLTFAATTACAQNLDTVIAGPYGVPRLVQNEGKQWEVPIKVYEDSQVSIFVPDLTSPEWLAWHKDQFQSNGVYFTYLYVFARRAQRTGRMLITVDTKNDTVAMRTMFTESAPSLINTLPLHYRAAIRKATIIVKAAFARTKTMPSIQDYAIQQRQFSLWMLACHGSGPQDSDCTPDSKEFAKKHPISVATTVPTPIAQPTPSLAKEPKLTFEPPFEYPAMTRKIDGEVVVHFTIDEHGVPQDIAITKSVCPALDWAAYQAVSKYRFDPGTDANGKPHVVESNVNFNFQK